MECSCSRCQNLCSNKPGWFTPQQIAPLARKLELSIADLFERYLTIDAVLTSGPNGLAGVYVLAPANSGTKPGAISDPTTHGTCIWYKDGKCEIHELKPTECAAIDHSTSPAEGDLLRASILKQWIPHRKFVQSLYGKKLKLPAAIKE